MIPRRLAALALLLSAASLRASPADVVGVTLARRPYGTWEGVILVRHEDQGWEHWADRWEVLDQAGRRIVLRSLDGPKLRDVEVDGPVRRRHLAFPIPEGTTKLVYRVHCKQSGWVGKTFEVDLSKQAGPGFTVGSRGYKYLPDFENVAEQMRSWRARKHVLPKPAFPYPPDSPIPAEPPDPIDTRPDHPPPAVPALAGPVAP